MTDHDSTTLESAARLARMDVRAMGDGPERPTAADLREDTEAQRAVLRRRGTRLVDPGDFAPWPARRVDGGRRAA